MLCGPNRFCRNLEEKTTPKKNFASISFEQKWNGLILHGICGILYNE